MNSTNQPTTPTWYQAAWTDGTGTCDIHMAGDRVLARQHDGLGTVLSIRIQDAKTMLRTVRDSANRPVPAGHAALTTHATPTAQPTPLSPIQNGTYTVEHSDGTYETVQVEAHWVEAEAKAGKQVASYLSGPDNSTDFTGFAFLTNGRTQLWRKYRQADGSPSSAINKYLIALAVIAAGDSAERAKAGEAYAVRSSRCSKCNRKLTVPASIHQGMGPDCAQRYSY